MDIASLSGKDPGEQRLALSRAGVVVCKACPLRGRPIAPGFGPHNTGLMLLGEGPGKEEARKGAPFVGKAGAELDGYMKRAGLRRDAFYVTNCVKCHPPGDRDPTAEELACCFGWLALELATVRPEVLGSILDVDIVLLRERYTVEAYLTAAVTADTTTSISVTDTEDFEVGGTLRFHDISAGTYEDETISAVDAEAGTITVSAAPSTSYKAGEDMVTMTKAFMADDKVIIMPSDLQVQGQAIAEWFNAPFGIPTAYDIKLDQKPEWDPEALWIRAQRKGLPVLYFPEAVYILDVQ